MDPNLIVALLLDIGWRVAQQVLSMDLFTDLGDRIFEGVLLLAVYLILGIAFFYIPSGQSAH